MAVYDLGPRTAGIYHELRDRIRSGELAAGTQLPPHRRLAADFGVAPMSVRHVLARLEADGLISRQIGRGTFVCAPHPPRIVILASSALTAYLAEQLPTITAARTVTVCEANEALTVLASEPHISLAIIEIGPAAANLDLLRTLRRRWPQLVVAAVVQTMTDLVPLQDLPECPALVLPLPLRSARLAEIVRLAVPMSGEPSPAFTTGGLETLKFQARLLDSVDQAIIATSPAGEILYWNTGAQRLYGWTSAEVMGRNVGQIIVSPDQFAVGMQIMEQLRRGEIWSGEFEVQRRDGTLLPVLVTDSPIRDSDGNLIGIIGVAVDISERKQAERDRLALARLEMALIASQMTYRNLGERLALTVPRFGQLADDPQLPAHLRPIAGVMLRTVEDLAQSLEHGLDLPQVE